MTPDKVRETEEIYLPGASEEENKELNRKYQDLKNAAAFDMYGNRAYLLDDFKPLSNHYPPIKSDGEVRGEKLV